MKFIDIDKWKRKEHFEFFSNFDEPFFGIVSEIDCTSTYKTIKEKNYSFFAYYLHKSLIAANEVEEFRHRISKEKVIIYDAIHASPTIGRENGTFAFSFMEFNRDYELFENSVKNEIDAVQNSSGLRLNENEMRNDVIHYSAIPWFKFTGLTHARKFNPGDSVPKISFGKIFLREGRKILPVSVNAHHGLVDGFHVGKYLALFQELMDN